MFLREYFCETICSLLSVNHDIDKIDAKVLDLVLQCTKSELNHAK
jgi:hypothetical protein